MSDLISRVAQPGRVTWIGLRPARRDPMQVVPWADVTSGGLEGDHGRRGKRAVTLVQQEHLAAIGSYLGGGPVSPSALRRNLVIAGVNLASLRGRHLQVGTAILFITGPCAPCSRMEEAFGLGGYSAVRGHGGVTADVYAPGRIALADSVVPQPATAD